MNSTLIIRLSLFTAFVFAFFALCSKQPVEPDGPCINDQPVEDTTRVYVLPNSGDTLSIYPQAIFARFYPWVTDTAKIEQLLAKHHLRFTGAVGLFGLDDQLAAWLCVTDNRRAEYHFTPYGKEGYCNFGTDSLVEYAFGVFNDGYKTTFGNIWFYFKNGTKESTIDSLFNALRLRFLYKTPHHESGHFYVTLITPRAKKNVIDLGNEIQFLPFVEAFYLEIAAALKPVRCDSF